MKRDVAHAEGLEAGVAEQLRMLLADADQRRQRGGRRGGGKEHRRGQGGAEDEAEAVTLLEQDGVLVGVRGRAAAEQDQRLGPGFQSLCGVPGAITTVSPARTSLLVAEAHAPGARGEEVDLLGGPVQVLDRLAARRHRRLGQRLVDGVAGRDCPPAHGWSSRPR